MPSLSIPVAILGGGAAGLWLLAELRSAGIGAVLVEPNALGRGQSIAAQGILHSGLKYALGGIVSDSGRAARDMPARWRESLLGDRAPDLRGVEILAEAFYLWGTASLGSRLGMMAAQFGLQASLQSVARRDCPALLGQSSGTILRVDEMVLSPHSLLQNLAHLGRGAILKVASERGMKLSRVSGSDQIVLHLTADDGTQQLELRPEAVVLTAGEGNQTLRAALGLASVSMQRRPLHMVLVRGALPMFFGHCVAGATTRVSITSARESSGQVVWQVGGQIAEDGVKLDSATLIDFAQRELAHVLPGLDLHETEWGTYRVNRAEALTRGGQRPSSFSILEDGPLLTAWPTKLVLVPQLAAALREKIESRLRRDSGGIDSLPETWPAPDVAPPPWRTLSDWQPFAATHPARAA